MKSEDTVLFGPSTGASGTLVCVAGTMSGRSFEFGVMPFTIGRADASSLPLADEPGVSKEHAKIVFGPPGFVLTDLGSRNGTFVNGNRVESIKLSDGDEIQICGCILKVALKSAAPSPTPPAAVRARENSGPARVSPGKPTPSSPASPAQDRQASGPSPRSSGSPSRETSSPVRPSPGKATSSSPAFPAQERQATGPSPRAPSVPPKPSSPAKPPPPKPDFDPDKTMIAAPADSTAESLDVASPPRFSKGPVTNPKVVKVISEDVAASGAAFDDGRTMIAPPTSSGPKLTTSVVKQEDKEFNDPTFSDAARESSKSALGLVEKNAASRVENAVASKASAESPAVRAQTSSMSVVVRNAIIGVLLIGVIGAALALAPWQKQSTAGRKVPLPPRSPVDMKIQFVQQWCPDLPCAKPLQLLAAEDDVNGNAEAVAATDPCYRECLSLDQ